MTVLRDTCLRCGTQLVPYGHWGICPLHDAAFLRDLELPEGFALVRRPELTSLGVPQPRTA